MTSRVAELATDVELPDHASESPVPVVVVRTPYDRSAHRDEAREWARRGIGFVVQDVRGRYGSPGTWVPYRNERVDGSALLDWVLSRPWCDGNVFLAGASYAAFTAWATAVTRPSDVAGVIALVPAMGFDRVKFDPSGILRLAEHASWWVEHADARESRNGLAARMFRAEPGLLARLPVVDIAERMWASVPGWTDVVVRGDRPDIEAITDTELAELPMPVLHIGGWRDLLRPETLRQWAIVGSVRTPRPARQLLLGPWGHRIPGTGATRLEWIRSVLSGELRSSARVHVGGGERWWTGSDWPPKTGAYRLYATADRALSSGQPTDSADFGFTYDPADPFPSREPGTDRRELDRRTDVVRFETPAVEADLLLAGEPVVRLDARTDAVATDWIVRLVERTPEGRVLELSSAAVDTGHAGAGPYDLTLTALHHEVALHSRLELEITSSDFPNLARNLGSGADRYQTSMSCTARQTVRSGSTWIELPVVEEM